MNGAGLQGSATFAQPRPLAEDIDKVWFNGRQTCDYDELRHQTVGLAIRCLKAPFTEANFVGCLGER
ncbi:hypothetical protein LNO81_30930 [Klebsiella variicola subsp. variicola]|nr:hypothetical protein [Klebsiella variicola subsp. variicola]